MTSPKRIDLDDELDLEEPDEQAIPITLFGQEFRVLTGLNGYGASQLVSGDAGSFAKFVDALIHPEDRQRFRDTLVTEPKMKVPANLNKVMERLVQVATEGFPSTRPSASSRTASKRTSTPRSAPATSTRKAAASATRR